MSKQLRLDVAQLTDVGRKRSQNEDNMAYVIPKDAQVMARNGALFIVADGMGGHAAGEVASEIAVDTVTNFYYQQDDIEDIPGSLINAIRRANALIHQRAAENMLRSGMGTTCVSAVMRGTMAYIANVGDSRAYMVRHGQIRQVSQDHSWVEEQVRAGLLTKDQARSHSQRNVITRSLGTQSDVEVDVFSERLEEGDSLILCTDGLSGSVSEDELRAIVSQYQPQESVYHLVERANENGGPDNITAIVVRVLEVGEDMPGARKPVRVGGGHEADEDTAVLGKVPTSSLGMPGRLEDGRIPTGSLRMSTGPLYAGPGSVPSPQAAVAPPETRKKPGRLFYPTLAVVVILLVALLGGSAYYFFLRPLDSGSKLDDANTLINQAASDVRANNISSALQKLSRAQSDLRTLQSSNSLSTDQHSRLTALQSELATTFQDAAADYNQQASIQTVTCPTSVTPLDTGGNDLQPDLLAVVSGGNTTYSYVAQGNDHDLYLVNGTRLQANPKHFDDPLLLLANDTSHIYVLTKSLTQGNTPATYTLHALTADQSGALAENKDTNSTTLGADDIKLGTPVLMTAWNADIYVILKSSTPNQVWILHYKVDHLKDAPQRQQISISQNLLSVAASDKNMLFLLNDAGQIQSLSFTANGSSTAQDIHIEHAILSPLQTNPQGFNWATPIATPAALQSPQGLTIPGATTADAASLTTGLINGEPHLFVVDNISHRILDLKVDTTAAAGAPTPTPTPMTTATATTTAGNPPPGSRVVDGSTISMQLVQQYVSANTLPPVKNMVVNPRVTRLVHLVQQSGKAALLLLDTQQKTCTAAS